jgi:hypothetical protein
MSASSSCQARATTSRGVLPRLTSETADSSAPTTILLLRTSGAKTLRDDPCLVDYLALLQRELRGLAKVGLLTDLSLWAPESGARQFCDQHEALLRSRIPAIASTMAFTAQDIIDTWPAVSKWPTPGDDVFHRVREYPESIQSWLQYVRHRFRAVGKLTRRRTGSAAPVSNLIPYFIPETALCLWLRRQALGAAHALPSHVWVVEDDAPFLGSIREPLAYYSMLQRGRLCWCAHAAQGHH